MRQKRFLIYLLCQAIVIVGVILIFRTASDIKVGSVEAGVLFVLVPMILAFKEYRVAGLQQKIFYFGLVQFWVLFAVPILGLRLSHWESPFSELSLFGVPGTLLHQGANGSYLLWMACTLWCHFRSKPA